MGSLVFDKVIDVMSNTVKVGIIGSQFISAIHAKGVAYADLLHGNAIETYSLDGYDYAVEKAGSTRGWSFTIYEETYNYGFHQEMAHFIDCVQHDRQPLVTGEDGRVVLEVLFAAYESARTGRKVELPFKSTACKPIDLWKPNGG